VFTDFYIADRSQAAEIGQDLDLIDPALSLDGVSEFELIELSMLLRNGLSHRPALGFLDEEQGLAVVVAEQALVEALAALTAAQLPAIAGRWATAEGFAGWPEQQVQEMLSGLQTVAAKAFESRLDLLYITSI
jgi:hypothetical protein